MKIKEYMIVRKIRCSDLEDEVTEAIEEGWQPLGGVAVSPLGDYMQAMVKYELE